MKRLTFHALISCLAACATASAQSGIITTVAGDSTGGYSGDGGPATSAQLGGPSGLAMGSSGNLYIADTGNNVIRRVTPGGVITTYAGNGKAGYSGDGGQATAASLNINIDPVGIATDSSGNLYIADSLNNRVRKVTPAGIITTVAGNGFGAQDGLGGFAGDGGAATSAELDRNPLDSAGDGGPATSALLNLPEGVVLDSAGSIYIADNLRGRVRKVSESNMPAPSITSGRIVPIYSNVNTIQPGEWISIFGTNLASTTATWTGTFPTALGGASVTIDGKSAYLIYASPTQLNVQAPSDTATGSVPVVVTTANGTATSAVTLAQFAPSFCLLDTIHVTGIILRSNGSGTQDGGTYDILGPTGTSLGYPTVAARAGDIVEFFAVGLGPTNPSAPAGQAFSGAAPTTYPVSLTINKTKVIPTFGGLSSAGLYQINIVVPAGLGTGDLPLTAIVNGLQTPAGAVISLQ